MVAKTNRIVASTKQFFADLSNYVKTTEIDGHPIISVFWAYCLIFVVNCVVWGHIFSFWLGFFGYNVNGLPWFVGGLITFIPYASKTTFPVGAITLIIFILMKSIGA